MKTVLVLCFSFSNLCINAQQLFHKQQVLMGCNFDISVVAQDSVDGNIHIDIAINEIKRIEQLISSWDKNSQTTEINKNAGLKPTKVDHELFELIERSITISKITDGAFDISYASMDKVWRFDGSMQDIPSDKSIQSSISKVGYNNILLNKEKSTVFLILEGMKIGFGAIGKGYAADKAKKLLQSKGVKAGIINASGDMSTWGKRPDGKDWMVAITNPLNKNSAYALLPISNGSVVTSGNYEKFILINGQRYSHIINPRTGMPSRGIISSTVFAPSAELADALATSIFVMGVDVGLNRINQIPNVECIIVGDNGQIYKSKNININEK